MSQTEILTSSPDGSQKSVPGYGVPSGTDYPNIDKISTTNDERINFSRDELSVCETVNSGYMFYVVKNTVFAKDISGFFYKLNNETRRFEWFADGWIEDNENTIGISIPSAPTYVSFNKNGGAIFPMNDDKPPKPTLPRNELGETIFPLDPATNLPLFPVDFNGEPCLPVGDDGKPFFPLGMDGRPIVPINSEGIAVFPRDEDGKVIFPERDGRIIPPATVYGNAVVPIKSNGEPDIPCDANGHPQIWLGGQDGMTPMTEDEFKHWQYLTAMGYGDEYQGYSEEQYTYDVNAYEMSQNQHALEAYKNNNYEQSSQQDETDSQKASEIENVTTPAPGPADLEAKKAILENEKRERRLKMEMRSLKLLKGKKDNGKEADAPDVSVAAIPADRPPLPNKEKEKNKRFIPESMDRRRPISRQENRYSDNRNDDRRGGYRSGATSRFDNNRGSDRDGARSNARTRRSRSRSVRRRRTRSRSARRNRSGTPDSRSRSPLKPRSPTPIYVKKIERNRSRTSGRKRRYTRRDSSRSESTSRSRSDSRTRSHSDSDDDRDKSPEKRSKKNRKDTKKRRNASRNRSDSRTKSRSSDSDDDRDKSPDKRSKKDKKKSRKGRRSDSESDSDGRSSPEMWKTKESVGVEQVVEEQPTAENDNDDEADSEVSRITNKASKKDNKRKHRKSLHVSSPMETVHKKARSETECPKSLLGCVYEIIDGFPTCVATRNEKDPLEVAIRKTYVEVKSVLMRMTNDNCLSLCAIEEIRAILDVAEKRRMELNAKATLPRKDVLASIKKEVDCEQQEPTTEEQPESHEPMPEESPASPEPRESPASPEPRESPASPEPRESPASPEPRESPASPEPRESPASPEPRETPASPEPRESPASPEPRESPASPEPRESPASPEPREIPASPEPREIPASPEPQESPARPRSARKGPESSSPSLPLKAEEVHQILELLRSLDSKDLGKGIDSKVASCEKLVKKCQEIHSQMEAMLVRAEELQVIKDQASSEV